MRTSVIVGLVVGPVLLLGAPLALASGVSVPPEWTAPGAFALAGLAAVGGVVLLALSFRPRRRALVPPPSAESPESPESPAPLAPLTVVRNARPGRYVTVPAQQAGVIDGPDPPTDPVAPSRSRYVTLRTRRRPRPESASPARETLSVG